MSTTEELTPAMTAILEQIESLPFQEQFQLSHLLAERISPSDVVTAEMLKRRVEDFTSGRDPGVPGEIVMQRLREKYG